MTEHASWRFTHAVSRLPAASIAGGLRAAGGPDPDHRAFLAEHAAYVAALKEAGAEVTVLPALADYPDSVFVEDTAICTAKTAILLRPGAASRFGEAGAIAPALEGLFPRLIRLETGTVDGGDVLLTDRDAFIGLSERTDRTGAESLASILERLGLTPRIVATPAGVLHFKSDCGLIDSETIFATRRLAASGCFEGYRVIEAPAGEEAAANLIRFNDHVFMRSGFPETREKLERVGYSVRTLDAEEAAKVDGGLSCMSLRFSLNA